MDNQNNLQLIVILGPTAIGKTKLAVSLANQLHGEIISNFVIVAIWNYS